MWWCKKCGVAFLPFLVFNMVSSMPQYTRPTKEVTNSSAGIVFAEFRPQIPGVSEDPPCANNETFCENVDYYPYIHLKYLLERNASFYGYAFLADDKNKEKEELAYRQSTDGTYICRSISKTIFPKVGKNKNNKWKFIVNQDNFSQGIRVETCHNPDQSCDMVADVPAYYTTFCRQKYLLNKLISLDDRGYPAPDTFKIPSACCCAYRKTTHFLKQFKHSSSPAKLSP